MQFYECYIYPTCDNAHNFIAFAIIRLILFKTYFNITKSFI